MTVLNDHEETQLTTSTYRRRRRRFEKLIDHLKEVARRDPESFNLSTWISAPTLGEFRKATKEWPRRWKAGQPLNCGTTACLVGHLPLVFPQDFKWDREFLRILDTSTYSAVQSRHRNAEICPKDLEQFFGLNQFFWQLAIYSREGYWEHKPDPVTVADMVKLLCDAKRVADRECEKA